MKTRKHLVAFAAQLFPAILFAISTNVTFEVNPKIRSIGISN